MFRGTIYKAVMSELKQRVKAKQEEYDAKLKEIALKVLKDVDAIYENAKVEKQAIATRMVSELLGK